MFHQSTIRIYQGQHSTMSDESNADSSMLVNEEEEESKEEEEESEEEESEEEDKYKGLYCDIELRPFVIQLFSILDQGRGRACFYQGWGRACFFSTESCQIVKRLLKDHPEAAGICSTMHGGFALHLACRKHALLEIIVSLTRAFPDALRVYKVLHYRYTDFDQYRDYEMCPLQQALCNANVSFDVVCFLVSQYPGALQLPSLGDGGSSHNALHVACEANVLLPIIEYLWHQWPEALQQQGEHGFPLHYACRSGTDISTIHFLIQAWPDALQIPNESGALPLHVACRFRAEHDEVSDDKVSEWSTDHEDGSPAVSLIRTLVEAWLAALCVRDDEQGYLPLHQLCCCSEETLLIDMQILVEYWLDALEIAVTTNGMLPLHLACLHGCPVDVI